MPTWEDVVEIGTRLPGVEVGTSFRTPALRVRGKGMCRLRTRPDAGGVANNPRSARLIRHTPWSEAGGAQ